MLNATVRQDQSWLSALVLPAAIVAGSWAAYTWPAAETGAQEWQDATVWALVFLLLVELRLARWENWRAALAHLPFIGWAVVANFLIIPWLGLGLAQLFVGAHPLLFIGLAIYFMAPCTDWFLGFTRLAGGDTTLGAALIPVNMALQLLLYPFFVGWLAPVQAGVDAAFIASMLLQWFVQPLAAALAFRLLLRWVPGKIRQHVMTGIGKLLQLVIVVLVFEVFAGHGATMRGHWDLLARMLAAVFVFFALTYVLGELIAHRAHLPYAQRALLAMTTAARNAPLMLGITMTALPGQPQIYAAIVIGMLLEFPHLMLLRHLLLRKRSVPLRTR